MNAEVANVGTTAVRLDGVAATRPRDARKTLLVGGGSATVYLGGPGVTAATGFPLAAGTTISFDATDGAVWAVAAAAATVNILEGF